MFKEIKTKTMNKLKLILLAATLLFCIRTINAQIPINDAGWVLQTSASEEFNSALNFTTKWYSAYPWGGFNGGAEQNLAANLDQSSGTTLKIKADTLIPSVQNPNPNYNSIPPHLVTYVYQGGAIQSRPVSGTESYKFGYLEIYAKFPTGSYTAWPAFWLWSASCSSPQFYNEIDIAENGGPNSYNGYMMGTNVWINTSTCSYSGNTSYPQDITNLPLISAAFHKYAVKWEPHSITWYIDDAPVRTMYDATGVSIPQNAMAVIINFAIDPWNSFLPSDWNTFTHNGHHPQLFPQYFEIDYMRYYKLNTDCGTNLTICTISTDYSTRAVKKTITTGGSCSPTINTSDSYTLRATDHVVLDAGTTINSNSSGYFAVEITACPQ